MKKMKHIKEWTEFSINENIDNILDKMSRGEELTPDDEEKMQSYSSHLQKGGYSNDFDFKDKRVFTDDNGYFKFTLDEIKHFGDKTDYIGTIECPDYKYYSDDEYQEDEYQEDEDYSVSTIPGILTGKIEVDESTGAYEWKNDEKTNIKVDNLTIWDFCEELADLGGFLEDVIAELENEN